MASSMIEDLISAAVEQKTQAELRQKELEAAQKVHQVESGTPVMRQVLSGISDRLFEELGIKFVPDTRSSTCACGIKAVFQYEEVSFTIFYESESTYSTKKQVRLTAEVSEGNSEAPTMVNVGTQAYYAIDQEALLLFIYQAGVKSAEFTRNTEKRAEKKRLEAIERMAGSQAFATGDEDNYYPGMTLRQYYIGTIAAAIAKDWSGSPEQVAAHAVTQADALIEALADVKLSR